MPESVVFGHVTGGAFRPRQDSPTMGSSSGGGLSSTAIAGMVTYALVLVARDASLSQKTTAPPSPPQRAEETPVSRRTLSASSHVVVQICNA